MPLSPAAPRKRLHVRDVRYEGFVRDDGLIDIEGHLIDVKDHDLTLLSGVRPRGEPVHDMWVRLTIDRDLNVRAIEASTDAMPYPGGCDSIADAYGKLVGTNLMHGFRRALSDAMGGVKGCTHLTEMIGYLPTAAVQLFSSLKKREDEGHRKPFQLDRCHALETTGDVVRRYYPKWYRGARSEVEETG
jgi:hypothetical protein